MGKITSIAPLKNPNFVKQLCAGIVDKKCSIEQIAKEEVLEECGYDVPVQNLEKISAFYTSVGISGTHQTLYYAQIDESYQKTTGVSIAFYWFFNHKKHICLN